MAEQDPTEQREHLAQHVGNRRRELGLSIRSAAKAAGISPITWTGAEQGTRKTSDHIYAALERTLRWQAGSVAAVLAGGEPTPVPHAEGHATLAVGQTPVEPEDEATAMVRASNLTDEQKDRVIRMLTAERIAAERRHVERADELIRLLRTER